MDSAYWDIFPDAEDADTSEEDGADVESSCSPDLEIPCARCKHSSRLCKRCRERRRQHRLEQDSTAPRRLLRKSSLELACFPEPATASGPADHGPAAPEVAIPEVVLQHPPSDNESPDAAQKNTLSVPGPVYASMYTNSPSWMSTYTSSTCATTYTTTHERSRRDGEADVDRDWLDVRRRRPPYPRRPRTSRRDGGGRSVGGGRERRSTGWGFGTGTGFGWGIELRGWDAGEVESGSYCVLEGARWAEQRVVAAPRQQQYRNQKNVGRARRRWRGDFGHFPGVSRARPLPLVEPPTPRYMFDVFAMSTAGTGEGVLRVPYVSEMGHARVVYTMAYGRGTGSARGLWGLFAPKDQGKGDFWGVLWREGIWKGILGCLNDVLSLGRGGAGLDDVD
ncbi:uncharacterized protein ColSpa_01640 [Colletotrichum spaethianum]|uniref:Uncharacterized protein n=1 Tax=Colletotrichum spaethianum TaxID=700344 RepID=A0AA37L7K5_9PEZI|nr:uncharacterized protein ColSpa_01640 [Colletotrichum spaethianum]GKT41459.1 hypothetical protein ColSpa_01640 [Colletotrichum spaethianum]